MGERVEIGSHVLYRADCRDVLDEIGRVDAVVTDPPYGIGEAAGKNASRSLLATAKDYGDAKWDDETISRGLMMRVLACGTWRAVFGGNYYVLPASSCWLVWDKCNGKSDFADCELVWTNFPKAVRRLQYRWNGMHREHGELRGDHPTQKPVGVMSWVIGHIPGEPKTILDPFMGSGTTGVACANAGINFIGVEREQDYFETACKRVAYAESQLRLFA